MTLYTETRDRSKPFLQAGREGIIQFWQWGKEEEKALESAEKSIRFLNFVEQTVQEQSAAPGYGLSFTTLHKKEEKRTVVIPKLEGMNINNPAMTSMVRRLLRIFWAIVVSKALQASFPVDKTSITVFKDPDEGRLQVVLRLFTGASASQAVAFWESLEKEMHTWVSQLDDRNRLVFMRDITMRIHWQ